VNDLYIEKTEDSKTKISPTTTLKQTFYLISEIYNNSPLFEVHVIDLIDNFAQYIDICRPKYKSAIINIEDKSCRWVRIFQCLLNDLRRLMNF
jgi:hypothetical protein